MQAMGHAFFPQKLCSVNNTNLGLAMPKQVTFKTYIHTPHLTVLIKVYHVSWRCLQIWHLHYMSSWQWSWCPFDWVMVICIQAVSWPSHSNFMISLDKIITKISQLLSNITKRCSGLENTWSFICSAQVVLEYGSKFPLMTSSKQ